MSVALFIKQMLPHRWPRAAANNSLNMLLRPGGYSFSSRSASKGLFNWLGVSNHSTSGMDNHWDPRLWTPTTLTREHPMKSLNFNETVAPIIESTKSWSSVCYDPAVWISRAINLAQLGYPELAAGDAYKARLLARAKLDSLRGKPNALDHKFLRDSGTTESQTVDVHCCSLLLLAGTLWDLFECSGMLQICEEGRKLYPTNPDFERASQMGADLLTMKQGKQRDPLYRNQREFDSLGWVKQAWYPFMAPRHMIRPEDTVRVTQKAFAVVTPHCSLASRDFSNASSSKVEGFGIYAITDIKPGTRLFEDKTILGITDRSSQAPSTSRGTEVCDNCCGTLPTGSTRRVKAVCCSSVYCSEYCHTMASYFYHHAICGQDYDWLFKGLQGGDECGHEFQGAMMLRVLSICVQSDCHPLDHPFIARLTPNFVTDLAKTWTFRDNIIRPNRMLQQLGVDIFQDLRYDTWVLQHLENRLKTNENASRTRDGRPLNAVNPLYSFLNHSCEPNAIWRSAEFKDGAAAHESTTIVVVANRAIKKGEEICIDYRGVSLVRDKTKRQEMLSSWLPDGLCQCTRCQRES